MLAELDLSPVQIEDLSFVRQLGVEKLRKVLNAFSVEEAALTPRKLVDLINQAIEGDDRSANGLVRQILAFNGFQRRFDLKTDEVAAAIRSSVSQEWSQDELDQWKEIEPAFLSLVESRSARLVAKVIDLSYEYAYLYQQARILTDVRPLFSENADHIEAAVVSFTLRLRYDGVDGNHGLSVAMDIQDVEELLEQCERALVKAKTAHDVFQNSVSVPTHVTGG